MSFLNPGSLRILTALTFAFLFGVKTPLSAATLLWVGDVDAAWNTNSAGNTNWTTDALPAASGDTLQFTNAGSSGTTLNNDLTSLSVAGLTFNTGASAFTLTGNTLTLSGGITNNSASLQTLNLAITLGGTSTISAASGALTFGSAISSASNDLTVSGANTITLNGLSFSANANKITSTGADVRFVGNSTIFADMLISSGTVRMQSGTQVFNNGLKVDGVSSVLYFEGASVTVNGIGGGGSGEQDSLEILNSGTINVTSGTVDLTPSRFWMQEGTLNITGGSVSISNALIAQATAVTSRINVSGGTLSLASGNRFANNGNAILTVSGTGAVTWALGTYGVSENGSGNVVMNGGTLNMTSSGSNYFFLNGGNQTGANLSTIVSTISLNAGTLSTRGFAMNTNTNANNRLAELRFNGGTLRATDNNGTNNFIPDSATLTSKVQAGGAIIDTNGYNITIADNLEHDSALGATVDGGLTKNGTGTLTLNAANTYTGVTTLNAGTLAISNNTGGTVTYRGQINGAGGVLTLSGANTLNFTGGFSMTNGASTITATGSDVRVNSDGVFNAAVTVNSGGTLKFQSGTQTFTKGLVASGTNSVLSFEGASVTHSGNGDGNNNNGLQLDNGGIMNVSAGTVVFNSLTRAFIQTSTINVTGGALTLNNALFAQGTGTVSNVNVSAGSLAFSSSVRFANNGNATLTVSGTGAVTWAIVGSGLSENGTGSIVMNGGTLTITSSGTNYFILNGGNVATFNTAVTSSIALNAGVLSTRGFAMNLGANSTNRLAELRFNGGTLKATDNNGTTDFIPSHVNLTSKVQAGGAVVDTNSYSITFADNLEHDSALGATADGGLTKNGAGTLTLTAANTYTGKTTVAAGTLTLSGSGSVAASAWLEVKSGATLNAASATQTLTNQVLTGTGSLAGTWVIGAGSILKPGDSTNGSITALANAGDSTGTLTIANLTLTTGATSSSPRVLLSLAGTTSRAANPMTSSLVTAFKDSSAGGLYDAIKVTGSLGLNAGSTIKVELAAGYKPGWGDVFNLMDWSALNLNADGTSGAFTLADLILPTNLDNGWFFATDQFLSNGLIYVVPEPSRALLLGVSLMLFIFRRRR